MGRFGFVCCVLALCMMYADLAYGMHEQFTGNSLAAPVVIFLPIFSVYRGAEINLSYDCKWDLPPKGNNQLLLALATKEEFNYVDFDTRFGCNFSDFNFTASIIHNGTASVNFHHIVEHYDSYYLLLLNCQDRADLMSYSLQGNFSIVNPDGELFCGDAPLIPLSELFSYLWGILLVFWLFLRLTHDCTAHNARRIRYTHDLGKRLPHWTVALIPVVQLAYSLLTFYLWRSINVVGAMPTLSSWEGSYALALLQRISRALMEFLTYGCVFVLCTGTRISRRRMSLQVFIIGLCGGLILAVCSFFDDGYVLTVSSTAILTWVFHFSARLIMLTLMYVLSSKQIHDQIDLGAFEARGSMYPSPDHPLYTPFERSRYFRSIRQMCTLWIVMDMAFQFFMKIFVEDWTWVSEFFSQFEYLLIFIMLILILRERPPALPAQVRANRHAATGSSRTPGSVRNETVKARLGEFVKQATYSTPA